MYVSYIFLTSLKIRRSPRLLELFDLIVYFHFILCNLCVLNTSIDRINIGKVHFCTTDNFKPVYVCLGSAARLPLKISDCCATNMDGRRPEVSLKHPVVSLFRNALDIF